MLGFYDTPFNRRMQFDLIGRTDRSASVVVRVDDWFLQETGVVHGGIITALADTAAVYALNSELSASESMTGLELKINFLRPATGGGGPITACATAVRRGRTIGVCDVEVWQEERLIAKGLFTYLYIRESEPSSAKNRDRKLTAGRGKSG